MVTEADGRRGISPGARCVPPRPPGQGAYGQQAAVVQPRVALGRFPDPHPASRTRAPIPRRSTLRPLQRP
ncbi:hypothetical protein Stube_21870 [Streptomyces tubercidicus]|uniref:Uncharacterized protein n=1 Tax=Streptomyces tubercidicus TaxID=47759 RepID=A0A640UQ37_9ACTN|nr:hypothetical protein Stube_21870 [Streptomyces tubercidicus]